MSHQLERKLLRYLLVIEVSDGYSLIAVIQTDQRAKDFLPRRIAFTIPTDTYNLALGSTLGS